MSLFFFYRSCLLINAMFIFYFLFFRKLLLAVDNYFSIIDYLFQQ